VQAGSAGRPDQPVPEHAGNLKAAETLVKDGFQVMVYCADDPIQCKMLEESAASR
jgi:thiazole synthase